MPKLKCPTEQQVQQAIDSLWSHVNEDYVVCHLESARWSKKAVEISKHYTHDCKKRAAPILKWIKAQCLAHRLSWHTKSVHMIDHSTTPPEIAPYIVVTMSVPELLWCRVEVTLYKPMTFSDIENKIKRAIAGIEVIRNSQPQE